jgi:hypothetical protein
MFAPSVPESKEKAVFKNSQGHILFSVSLLTIFIRDIHMDWSCCLCLTDLFFRSNTGTVRSNPTKQNKQTPWPLVRERNIPTDRPPLVDEI